jgi:nucleotide-binding universal stress UspA family protein
MTAEILLVIDDSASAEPMVQAAIELAERRDAVLSIQILSVRPLGIPALAPLTSVYVSEHQMLLAENRRIDEIRSLTAHSPRVIRIGGLHDDLPILTRRVGRDSHLADLIVIGGEDYWDVPWLRHHAAAALILAAGAPLLALPFAEPLPAVYHAVLGWEESAESRRAMHDLSDLMAPGGRVSIVTVGKSDAATRGVGEAARYLERRGFLTDCHQVADSGAGVASTLTDFAWAQYAQLLALGAFSHSRLHEIALGSVTRKILAFSAVPVLFSQ